MICRFRGFLLQAQLKNIEQIDELIKTHLAKNWTFDRLNKVTLAILRISIFSIIHQKEISPSIVIDEAIDLAKQFDSDESFKFINAMLDTIRKEQSAV